MIEWRWSNGQEYLKSPRPALEIINTDKADLVGTNAISQSLDGFSFEPKFSRNDNPSLREDLDNKISDRELIFQRGTNPFMQTDYVKDIVARDIFMKPINTTFDKLNKSDKLDNSDNSDKSELNK